MIVVFLAPDSQTLDRVIHISDNWSLSGSLRLFTIYHKFREIPGGMQMVNGFWFIPLENSRDKQKFWKGSPVFLVSTFWMEIFFTIYKFLEFHTSFMLQLESNLAQRDNWEILGKW